MKSAKFLPIFGSKPLDTCILVHLLLSCYKIIHSTTEYQVLNKSRDIKYSLISSTKNSCIDSFDFSGEKKLFYEIYFKMARNCCDRDRVT